MNKILTFLLLCAGFAGLKAQKLVYYVDVCSFQSTDGNPYLEFYLDVAANTVDFVQEEGGQFSGKVEVDLAIVERGSDKQVYARKFELLSGQVVDTSEQSLNFGILDVRRISLDPGKYIFTGYLRDMNNPDGKQHMFVREFEMATGKTEFTSLSEISFIQSFAKSTTPSAASKHGYDIIPLVTNGNFVDADEVLATLDDRELELERLKWSSRLVQLGRQRRGRQ